MPADIIPIGPTTSISAPRSRKAKRTSTTPDYVHTTAHDLARPFREDARCLSNATQPPALLASATAYVRFLEDRTKALEAAIRTLVAGDVLTQEQRTALLVAAYGARGGETRDANLLSEIEGLIIDEYRASDTDDRFMVRSILRINTGGVRT